MEKLGVEPIQLLTQIFNFLVMMFVLAKLLYKPILKGLEERKKKIEEGLEYTEKMKIELEKTEKKKAEILQHAQDEAKKLIDEAKRQAKQVEAKMIVEAQNEAIQIVEKAKLGLEIEKEELKREASRQAVKIAEVLAAKVLEETLSSKHHATIIEKKLKQIGKISS